MDPRNPHQLKAFHLFALFSMLVALWTTNTLY